MELFEKTLRETTIYDGKIIRVHVDDIELPNGKNAIRAERTRHAAVRAAVPLSVS